MRGLLILFAVATVLVVIGVLIRSKAREASIALFALAGFIAIFFALAVSGVL